MAAGRPRKQIDAIVLDGLASIGCTVDEMAAVLGVSRDTLDRNYADRIKTGKEKCKTSLRRMQWKAAENGSNAMLIWLGKQLLGQREHTEIGTADGEPLQVVVKLLQ